MATEQKKLKPLGQRLLEAGLISQAQLDLALREQKRLGVYLGDALEGLGFLTQDVLTSVLAQETQAEVVDVKNIVIDPDLIKQVPYDIAKRFKLIPLSRDGNNMTIAMADPMNVLALDDLRRETGRVIIPLIASKKEILDAIESAYSTDTSAILQDVVKGMESADMVFVESAESGSQADTAELIRLTQEEPVVKVGDQVKRKELLAKGITIYPGKSERFKAFRIANIGAIDKKDIKYFLKELKTYLAERNIAGETIHSSS